MDCYSILSLLYSKMHDQPHLVLACQGCSRESGQCSNALNLTYAFNFLLGKMILLIHCSSEIKYCNSLLNQGLLALPLAKPLCFNKGELHCAQNNTCRAGQVRVLFCFHTHTHTYTYTFLPQLQSLSNQDIFQAYLISGLLNNAAWY